MPILDVPPTRTALLALRRQLAFAEEGYSLLDRKRELLLLELAEYRRRAVLSRRGLEERLAAAFSALREAVLDAGSAAVDRAALGARGAAEVTTSWRRLMGLRLPESGASPGPERPAFGPGGTPAAADEARRLFLRALPLLAEAAALDTAVLRLSRELSRTQRRCNALSKRVIPDCRQTISFLAASLEEREREYFVLLKLIRPRLRGQART